MLSVEGVIVNRREEKHKEEFVHNKIYIKQTYEKKMS